MSRRDMIEFVALPILAAGHLAVCARLYQTEGGIGFLVAAWISAASLMIAAGIFGFCVLARLYVVVATRIDARIAVDS